MFYGDDVKAVALTSFSASEGKSTISFQLAASLAHAGKRVLLMDTDLRKSVLPSRLRVRGKVEGLTHYLSGAANASDLLYETDIKDLYIMFAGSRVPNAAEALGSNRFKKLMPALRDTFDYIIVDAVLMVIDSTNNSYKWVRRIKSQLERSGAKILGVILNRVDFKDKGGYYGKAYGYGDYGYGEEVKKNTKNG